MSARDSRSPATPLRVHGGLNAEELAALQLDPELIVDFSVNTNPFGPCPAVLEAVRTARIDRYPDPTSAELRKAIAGTQRIHARQVVVGNGASDLLWSIARALFCAGDTVMIAEPTFSEFRAALSATGVRCGEWRADERNNFAISLPSIARALEGTGVRGLYLCSPNTPTGASLDAAEVAEFALRFRELTIVLDESFLPLSERRADADAAMPPNVVRVRSLTKDHSIPGLRVGYLLAEAPIAERIEGARPAWTVNSIAQAAALAALSETKFVEESWRKLQMQRDRLAASLRSLGFETMPTSAFFFLVRVKNSAGLRDVLLRKHILVRDCTSFGLPGYIRIAARPEPDCERLIAALRELR